MIESKSNPKTEDVEYLHPGMFGYALIEGKLASG